MALSTLSWRSNSSAKRAFMHLDTVFTMVDRDLFTIQWRYSSILKTP